MSFEDSNCSLTSVDRESPSDVRRVRDFLAAHEVDYDAQGVDYTVLLETPDGRIAGTGSCRRDVLMYIVVASAFRETDCAARLVTHLQDRIFGVGDPTAFIFTRPRNRPIFEGLGFSEIATAPPLFCLLEFGFRSVRDFQRAIVSRRLPTATDRVAAIVANCNPFTKGHRYLIERAAGENEVVYLFVVEEELSVFPFRLRFDLVARGVADLRNVVVLAGGRYIVSALTFPTYFLKNEHPDLVTRNQAELDVTVFARWIAPALGVRRRYVGTEPTCPTTAAYNLAMKTILPGHGIEVVEVARLTEGAAEGEADVISASTVRRTIKEGELIRALTCLPEVTREFLLSRGAEPIIRKLRLT